MTDTASLQLSERIHRLGFSDIVRIRNRVLAMKQSGAEVLEFQGGEPFPPTPDFIKDAMKRALDENQTRYAPSSGIPSLLAAIEQKLHEKNRIPAGREQMIVTAGGAHGLFCSFQATLNPGDEIVFFSPYWTPIRDLVRYCGAEPILVPWEEVRAGGITEALTSRLSERTRAIYVNTPSNPTGDVLRRDQLEAIAAIARSRNLVVVADEAYEDLVYEGEHVSIASLPDMFPRTLTVYTLSKSYSMTGWRIGYVVADAPWMEGLRKLVLNSVNGVSTPTQFAAAAAIADRSDHLPRLREEYRLRRDRMVEALNGAGFRCPLPPGAFYLFVDVQERLGSDSWAAMEKLLETTKIATVPGVVFGPDGEGHLRMSFSTAMETIDRAVEALRHA